MDKIKLIHLFSGIGAPEMALKRLGVPLEIVGYSEIDKYAIQSYKAIHGDNIPNLGDIKQIERLPKCNLLFYGSPCLTGDTLILTSEGYKELSYIQVGDSVVGHDGNFHKVTAFIEQGLKPTYKINAMGMDSIRCTDNHKFYARKMYRKYPTVNGKRKNERHFKEPEWVECKDLDSSYYLGMPINKNNKLPVWNGVEYTRWKKEHNKLPLNNEEFWYLAGRYLGDGWLKTRKDRNNCLSTTIICCGKHKLEHLESKMNLFNYNKVEDRTVFRLIVSNKELAMFLSQFGRGASNKLVPGFVLDLPDNLLKSFCQGYLDSDGYYAKRQYSGSSVSRKLIYGMTQCIAKAYNRPFSIYCTKRKPKCIIEGRVVNQKDSYAFTFHKDNRGHDRAFVEDGYVWYPIKSIEPTGQEEPVYDITVEYCHSFVANNCITHNCTSFSVAGKQEGLYNKEGNQTKSGLLLEAERLIHTAKNNNELPEILIMENVKNLVGKKFKSDFDRWLNKLDSTGYNNYWQVLNAKDYGIPQNRERVFVVSIRKDIDKRGYTFPEKMPLIKRLKDVLEYEADEKYYLPSDKINYFINQLYNKIENTDVSYCIDANYWKGTTPQQFLNKCRRQLVIDKEVSNTIRVDDRNSLDRHTWDLVAYKPKIQQVEGNLYPNSGNPQAGRVYKTEGISPTLDTCQGGNRMPKIIEYVRIRRLTPLECWRLMGISDNNFIKAQASGVSNTQLYKQAGNSIVVDVLYYIFRNLFEVC